jgi:pimeloyl-ACP methyl ester carboxylesterase
MGGRLAEVKVPTLLVHGADDGIAPVKWAERRNELNAVADPV